MRLGVIALLVVTLGSFVMAQNTSALINQALDKQVKIALDGPLPAAMTGIGQQTGVRVEAENVVWDLLPWGDQTPIKARLENVTLRQGLTAVTRKLGLIFVLKDEAVELQPAPALRRLGRRSTLDELTCLDLLASTTLNPAALSGSVKNLTSTIDTQLADAKTDFAIENRLSSAIPNQLIELPRGATLMDGLEAIERDTSATWYPWGRTIVIVGKEQLVRTQLSRTLTARYNGVDISQVLLELSQRAGVKFAIEPGAIQQIPPEQKKIKLMLDNASIQQALESISGFTGLGYLVSDKGVYIWNQISDPARARDPIIGLVPAGDGFFVAVTQSQLSPELCAKLRERAGAELEKLNRQLAAPTTQK